SPNTTGQTGDITVVDPSPTMNVANKLTLNAAGSININSGNKILNNGTGALELDAVQSVNISAQIQLAGGLSVTAPTISLNVSATPSVQTGGGQTYNGPVTLAHDTILTDPGSGNIVIKSTLNALTAGNQGLVTKTDGIAEFDGAVGTTALK